MTVGPRHVPLLAGLEKCRDAGDGLLCESRARWVVLVFVSIMPFGVHLCYKMTSGIQTHLMHDAFGEPISTMQYGLLNSAVSWPQLFVPFLAGPFVDCKATRVAGIIATLIGLSGHLLFTLGCQWSSFPLALTGRAVFGAGEGIVMIAQGVAIAQWFRGAELTLAIAIAEMSHNVANWSGKVAVVAGIDYGGWWITLWIGVGVCGVGVIAACIFGCIERHYEKSYTTALAKHGTVQCRAFNNLTTSLWLLIVIHLLCSNVEHLFDTTSANFIQGKWHADTSKAAWLSSLNYAAAMVLCPAVGLLIDKSCMRMPLAIAACCFLGCAHLLLGLTTVAPAVGLLMLSLPQAVMPTILRASAPLVVSPTVFGLAFGAFGLAENLGKTIGAPLVGYVKDQDGNYTNIELGYASLSFVAASLVILLCIIDRRSGGVLGSPAYTPQPKASCDEENCQAAVIPR